MVNSARDKYSPLMGSSKRILDYELEILKDAELFVAQKQEELDELIVAQKQEAEQLDKGSSYVYLSADRFIHLASYS